MVDANGFRPNVGIVLVNSHGQLLWTRRIGGQDAWQFPQGGIKQNESPEAALFRELTEEVGLSADDVKILGVTRGWLRYRLPRKYIRSKEPQCIGQKQKWFLLELLTTEKNIKLDACEKPEFDTWDWVSYWFPVSSVVSFKREVYRKALKELAPIYNRVFAERHKPVSADQSAEAQA
ncbi:MAG: putative (di)nucleoside polyphosphate hydrolase [Flavobacteriales bacterium]